MVTPPAASSIPSDLVVLGLPYPYILHPGLILTVTLSNAQCLSLLRAASSERRAYVANSSSSNSTIVAEQRPMILACLAQKIPENPGASIQGDPMDHLHPWGCAGRVLRLINMPHTDQCRLLLSGMGRIHVKNVHPSNIEANTRNDIPPPPVARVEVLNEKSTASLLASPAHERLTATAVRLIDAMQKDMSSAAGASALARVPLLPPSLASKLMQLLETKEEAHIASLPDLLMGMLGGACIWNDRLEHLSLVHADARLERTADMFEHAIGRVKVLRELLTSVPGSFQNTHRVELLRTQLQSIVAQLSGASYSGVSLRVMDGERTQPLVKSRYPGLHHTIKKDTGKFDEPESDPMSADVDDNTAGDEVKELSDRLKQASMSPEARRVCERELRRLKKMPPQSMERGVLINYLDTMLDLPWDRRSTQIPQAELDALVPSTQAVIDPNLSLVKRAERVLEADHYGLEKVKKRILEYLAVFQLKSEQAEEQAKAPKALEPEGTAPSETRKSLVSSVAYKGPILLLVGPPGTGKTSIARSLAAALQRPFVRLSLGGVRDEAEIRGHRRTYVGALPGSIVSSLRKGRSSDCVMLLDELDKLSSGMGMHGDPTAAMLEVLDPEQNHAFKDHYLNVPIDLSRVVFIATANSLDTIPEPLLDRVDVVQIAGYTYDEKVAIAQKHLLPKQIHAQGLEEKQVVFGDDVLLQIAMSYTREAGVRTMERRVGDIVRAKAVEYATQRHTTPATYDPHVLVEDVERFLGPPTYEPEITDNIAVPGVATGMAYQGSGSGAILHIECAFLPAGTAALKLTGSLGDVIRESAELAFAWVKSHAFALGITADRDASFPQNDVHLHMPSGATPKDGPSAGVAFVCALVSMYLRVPLETRLAMTGEITLRGYVTPVGGIKEKVIGAHRAGVRKVILPQRNQRDFDTEIPAPVQAEMDVVYVRTIQDALHAVFGASLEAQISTLYGGIEGRRRLQELEWQSRL